MHHINGGRPRARRLLLLAAVLGAFLAAPAAPAAAAGYPSTECSGGTVVIDGYVLEHYTLRTNQAAGNFRWVCFSFDNKEQHVGGKVVVPTDPSSVVKVDGAWTACDLTPGQIAGDEGTIGDDTQFEVEVDTTASGDVQVCVMFGTAVAQRVLISRAGIPSVLLDDPAPYPYAPAPMNPTLPSAFCKDSNAGTGLRFVNAQIGAQHVWLYTRQESDSRAHTCWRVTSPLLTGGFPFGGRITRDMAGRQTFLTGTGTTDFTACDRNVLTTQSGFSLKYHAGGTGASYVCAAIPNVISVRIEANPSGEPGVVSIAGDPA